MVGRMEARPVRCLISAGPTREFFDPVRFVSNPSSGKMGFALARSAAALGWEVTLVAGPVVIPSPEGVTVEKVITGDEMFQAIDARFDDCDILIMTAAVMDYRPVQQAAQKIKKGQLAMTIEMEPVVDILQAMSARRQQQYLVGFAAETDHLEEYALKKLAGKNCDVIVANYVGFDSATGFEADTNEVFVFGKDGSRQRLGPAPKAVIAERLIQSFATTLAHRSPSA